jgi:beta-glucanase (GH16 family)
VMENVGSEPSMVHGSMHGPGYSGATALTSSYTLSDGARFSDGFHTFVVVWTPSSIEYLVDGLLYETQTTNTTRGNKWVFRHSFSLILDLAVGGGWPGAPTSATVFPATLLVDYVAVFRK